MASTNATLGQMAQFPRGMGATTTEPARQPKPVAYKRPCCKTCSNKHCIGRCRW
jgi:hypothetical protein